MSYSEKLRDPRWQKLRLEIMKRDNFACRLCAKSDKPLNVHHVHYYKDCDPWDYEPRDLITLCEPCHNDYHIALGDLNPGGVWLRDLEEIKRLLLLIPDVGCSRDVVRFLLAATISADIETGAFPGEVFGYVVSKFCHERDSYDKPEDFKKAIENHYEKHRLASEEYRKRKALENAG